MSGIVIIPLIHFNPLLHLLIKFPPLPKFEFVP